MKKIGRIMLMTVLVTSLVVTPVLATPSVNELEAGKAAVESEAQALQSQLTSLLTKIGQLEEELIQTGEEIIKATDDLAEAEESEKEQYEAMKLRIKYMYENGNVSEMETLVTSDSFSDLVNRAQYVSEVHSYDRKKLEEYVATKEKIKELKATLEEEQKNLEQKQEEFYEQEAALTSTLESKRAEIADFDLQIQEAAEAAAQAAIERENANNQNNNQNTGTDNNLNNSNSQSNTNNNSNTDNSDANNSSNMNSSNTNNNASTGANTGNVSKAQSIINAAYSQLGVPYVYGGTSPGSAFDCSGLVQYCHRQAGISLPRTSYSQGGCGVAVSNPQPGDIVCYGGHVGIYIGGGQMIHAPKPGDVVKVAKVYGSPWYRRCW